MPWPQSTDYNLAIQNPALCFRDADLRACSAYSADPVLGLPTPRPGNFADVYRLDHPDGHSWAVKCFTREVGDLAERYALLSDHLGNAGRSFIVEFRYLADAILVDGAWFPIVKMRWIEGKNLSEFVTEHADRPAVLDRLGHKWLKLARELADAKIGHGDLQHGNVLLVPNPQKASFWLRLIDYDGMYVPGLADRPSREIGFPGYQHPQRRSRTLYGPAVDRFSHLVIYTALRAVRVGGSALWAKFGSPENLLFSEADFVSPLKSDLLRTLFALPDPTLRHLLGHLVLAAVGDADTVPELDAVVPHGAVRRLDRAEYDRLSAVLGPILAPRRSRLDGRTPPPRLDDLPQLPSPLRQTRLASPPRNPAPTPAPLPEVPVARRIDETNSLPDWMLPEALPTDETLLAQLPDDDDDSDPESPVLLVPPLRPVPVEPVERRPPPVPLLTPVLVEETSSRPLRTAAVLVEAAPDDEPLDVVEVVPDDPPAPPRPAPRPRPAPAVEAAAEPEPRPRRDLHQLGLVALALALIGAGAAGIAYVLHRAKPTELTGLPRPELRLPSEVVVEGGRDQTLTVAIETNGQRGPFEVRLVGLPAVVVAKAKPPEAAPQPGEAAPAVFDLRAPLDVADATTTAKVQLYRGEERLEERDLSVVVRRPDFPRLVRPIARQRVEVNAHRYLSFEVERRGWDDRLVVELDGLPDGVKQRAKPVGRDETKLDVRLDVPADQATTPTAAEARLILLPDERGTGKIVVDRARVVIDFARAPPTRQFLTGPDGVVRVEAGKTAALRVTVNRKAYAWNVRLALRGLPPGVTAEAIDVPSSNQSGAFELHAAAAAAPGAKATEVEVVAYDGTEEIGKLSVAVCVVAPAVPAGP